MNCDDCGCHVEDGEQMWEVGRDHLVCAECSRLYGEDELEDSEGE